MSTKQKLQHRLAEIDKALGGEEAELLELRKGMIEGNDVIVKRLEYSDYDGEGHEILAVMFCDGEVIGGEYQIGDNTRIELNQDQAEIVANAYDIHDY